MARTPGAPAPPPCLLVIFGASGDLTARKLVPALFDLHRDGLLPEAFAVLGVARTPFSDEAFRERMGQAVAAHAGGASDPGAWDGFARRLFYHPGDISDRDMFDRLGERIGALCAGRGIPGNVLFYASVAPKFYAPLIEAIGRSGLSSPSDALPGFRRVIIEKPFGHDLESAVDLSGKVRGVFPESQVYRIDHYLGKETVQNMLVFRFANGIFEPVWNRNYIESVQITVAERLGVEGRGDYYEEAGAVRDMVQNHLLQLLALVAMEPPISLSPDDVRDEKRKLLRSVEPVAPERAGDACVRGQYAQGAIDGKRVPAYRAERKVSPTSLTETFAAFRFSIDNWRWGGVPFYLRSGKRMARDVSEIAIHFRPAPYLLFGDTQCGQLESNVLIVKVQPDEGIYLRLGAKHPGPSICVRPVELHFTYQEAFGEKSPPAYGRLLLDAMLGDATLFPREDEVEISWGLLSPFLSRWKENPGHDLHFYEAGSWGPAEADALFAGRKGQWRNP